ncbi:hypothetical protein H257_08556 [Aphanomyces astaci]|uniref:HTH CENPB-type domain-containing protein n=1 Tax=Aphanomyces astaci TaxID=112090 RepID=W4GDC3_APHAT|nr:hypothetical protein H257_08556 [Aphanomyces astaci]ETV77665.1 hypothetical protein H257_08556 [Aphanomyces astaci]|eukprot:XP_009832775.1 hypothetical protein H257_08556 [Aphanomyces astaci]
MERDGHPVNRTQILDKAAAIHDTVHGFTAPTKPTSGWYQKFLARHDQLKTKKSNVLSKSRHGVYENAVTAFYEELFDALTHVNMDPKRVFNMDETSFSPSKAATKVVVHRSTQHVYVEESTASAHVTIVACVGADGSKIPPLFILPGDRVTTGACDSLVIPGATVTTSEKGWSNSYICRKWLTMLDSAIPASTPRPILLILDGCFSHYSTYIYDEAARVSILLVFLPANSTHMFQPLDVTVFRPFKQAIRREIANNMWNDVATSINKQHAISIACLLHCNHREPTMMTSTGNDTAQVPVPDNMQCCVSVKVGRPQANSRTTVGDPVVLTIRTTDTFNVITAKMFDIVAGLVAAHHAGASNDRLLWGAQTPWETYVKVALNAPQSKYVALTDENYHDMIPNVWDNAGKTCTDQGSFTLQFMRTLVRLTQ